MAKGENNELLISDDKGKLISYDFVNEKMIKSFSVPEVQVNHISISDNKILLSSDRLMYVLDQMNSLKISKCLNRKNSFEYPLSKQKSINKAKVLFPRLCVSLILFSGNLISPIIIFRPDLNSIGSK